ncbi:hypothetical protein ACFL3S_06550 [Gemmatimonadota bacterium]
MPDAILRPEIPSVTVTQAKKGYMEEATDIEGWIAVQGNVVEGHRVASGRAQNTPHPDGTIALQVEHFARRGLMLDAFYPATVNVSIHPFRAELFHPKHTFHEVRWTTLHAPETFSFSRCYLEYQQRRHESWVYHPHLETKAGHIQPDAVVEVISPLIPGLTYGSRVTLYLDPREVRLIPAD